MSPSRTSRLVPTMTNAGVCSAEARVINCCKDWMSAGSTYASAGRPIRNEVYRLIGSSNRMMPVIPDSNDRRSTWLIPIRPVPWEASQAFKEPPAGLPDIPCSHGEHHVSSPQMRKHFLYQLLIARHISQGGSTRALNGLGQPLPSDAGNRCFASSVYFGKKQEVGLIEGHGKFAYEILGPG